MTQYDPARAHVEALLDRFRELESEINLLIEEGTREGEIARKEWALAQEAQAEGKRLLAEVEAINARGQVHIEQSEIHNAKAIELHGRISVLLTKLHEVSQQISEHFPDYVPEKGHDA